MMEPAASTLAPAARRHLDHVPGAAAGGDHVFDHHRGFAGLHREAAAQHHLAGCRDRVP